MQKGEGQKKTKPTTQKFNEPQENEANENDCEKNVNN